MNTDRHYTGFWVKEAIATIVCVSYLISSVSACNDSTNTSQSGPGPAASPSAQTPATFSLNSLIQTLEGAQNNVKEAVAPHADAVQARTKEEVEKLFRWEYRVVDAASNADPAEQQTLLSSLGDEGWECFHIDRMTPEKIRITCKRRPKSAVAYLKYLPGL